MEFLTMPFEIKEVEETDNNGQRFGIVKGFGSTFGNIDRGGDRILKGAFKDTLAKHTEKGRQIKMRSQHWDTIGGWPIFKETGKGLYLEGNINLSVQKGAEEYSLAKQGVVTDLSIGYRAVDTEYVTDKTADKDGNDIERRIRNIKSLELFEVSLVDFPMNDQANITAIKSCESIKDVSKFLKTKGLSNKEANEVIYFVKSLSRNDDDDEEVRNELFKSIDGVIAVNHIDQIINNIKRSL